jgi:hypothetical protein
MNIFIFNKLGAHHSLNEDGVPYFFISRLIQNSAKNFWNLFPFRLFFVTEVAGNAILNILILLYILLIKPFYQPRKIADFAQKIIIKQV